MWPSFMSSLVGLTMSSSPPSSSYTFSSLCIRSWQKTVSKRQGWGASLPQVSTSFKPRTETPQVDSQGKAGLKGPLTILRMAALECSAAVAISSRDSAGRVGSQMGAKQKSSSMLPEYLLLALPRPPHPRKH